MINIFRLKLYKSMKNLTFSIFNYAQIKKLICLSKVSEKEGITYLFENEKVANVYIFCVSFS